MQLNKTKLLFIALFNTFSLLYFDIVWGKSNSSLYEEIYEGDDATLLAVSQAQASFSGAQERMAITAGDSQKDDIKLKSKRNEIDKKSPSGTNNKGKLFTVGSQGARKSTLSPIFLSTPGTLNNKDKKTNFFEIVDIIRRYY